MTPEEPVVDTIQQAHTATNHSDLIDMIKELRNEVQNLKNKENINPNKSHNQNLSSKPWQYCWTHGNQNPL